MPWIVHTPACVFQHGDETRLTGLPEGGMPACLPGCPLQQAAWHTPASDMQTNVGARTHGWLARHKQTPFPGFRRCPRRTPRARLRGLAAGRATADNHAAENSGRMPGERVVARSACRVASRAPRGILGRRRGKEAASRLRGVSPKKQRGRSAQERVGEGGATGDSCSMMFCGSLYNLRRSTVFDGGAGCRLSLS